MGPGAPKKWKILQTRGNEKNVHSVHENKQEIPGDGKKAPKKITAIRHMGISAGGPRAAFLACGRDRRNRNELFSDRGTKKRSISVTKQTMINSRGQKRIQGGRRFQTLSWKNLGQKQGQN